MRRPDEIKILNDIITVTYNEEVSGATLDINKGFMEIGTKLPNDILDNLIHEISEAIHILLGTRHFKNTNDSFLFVMNHSEFQLHNSLLTSTLVEYVL